MATPAYRPSPAAPAAGREPVSRAAEALASGAALVLVAVGLLLRLVFTGGPNALLGAGAGMIVAGIALDLYARVVGAWATRRTPPLAVVLAVIGSPAVLWHALTRRSGRLAPERGAVAGLVVPVAFVVFFWAQASS